MSDIDLIIKRRADLDKRLCAALSTMERKSTIGEIRLEILENQRMCPHYSTKYNWVAAENMCPYCGKEL